MIIWSDIELKAGTFSKGVTDRDSVRHDEMPFLVEREATLAEYEDQCVAHGVDLPSFTYRPGPFFYKVHVD